MNSLRILTVLVITLFLFSAVAVGTTAAAEQGVVSKWLSSAKNFIFGGGAAAKVTGYQVEGGGGITQSLAPDLAISDVRVYPVSPSEGTEVVFEVVVKNIGTSATADYSFSYDFGEGGGVGGASPLSIPVGDTKYEKVMHIYKTAGTYTATFSVSTSNDADTSNNIASKQVIILAAPSTVPAPTPVVAKEQVKCAFVNSASQQKCYSDDGRFSCSGVESCLADVSGDKGTKLVWKSSCGGYAYTVIDGSNENAEFKCETNTPAPTPAPTLGCKDSDGGSNYYVKGVSSDGKADYSDYCSGSVLTERYCSGNVQVVNDEYTCPYGCNDGACLPSGGGAGCVRANPTVTISPSYQETKGAEKAAYKVTIVNKDNAACGPSIFRRTGTSEAAVNTDYTLHVTDEYGDKGLPAISPGSSLSFNLYASFSAGAKAGTYYPGMLAENFNDISYLSRAKATLFLASTPEVFPDVAVTNIDLREPYAVAGRYTPITVTINNFGTSFGVYNLVVDFGDGSNKYFTPNGFNQDDKENNRVTGGVSIKPGGMGTEMASHNYSMPGAYTITAEVAANYDTNRANDKLSKTIVIGSPAAIACADSDSGVNYYTYGAVKAGNNEYRDYCSGNVLAEYSCASGTAAGYSEQRYSCLNGCKDGACIREVREVPREVPVEACPAKIDFSFDRGAYKVGDAYTVNVATYDATGSLISADLDVTVDINGKLETSTVSTRPSGIRKDTGTISSSLIGTHAFTLKSKPQCPNAVTAVQKIVVSGELTGGGNCPAKIEFAFDEPTYVIGETYKSKLATYDEKGSLIGTDLAATFEKNGAVGQPYSVTTKPSGVLWQSGYFGEPGTYAYTYKSLPSCQNIVTAGQKIAVVEGTEGTCTDSDNTYAVTQGERSTYNPPGDDRFVKGTVSYAGKTFEDYCVNQVHYTDSLGNKVIRYDNAGQGETIIEQACIDGKKYYEATPYPCPNGCRDGACVKPELGVKPPEAPKEIPKETEVPPEIPEGKHKYTVEVKKGWNLISLIPFFLTAPPKPIVQGKGTPSGQEESGPVSITCSWAKNEQYSRENVFGYDSINKRYVRLDELTNLYLTPAKGGYLVNTPVNSFWLRSTEDCSITMDFGTSAGTFKMLGEISKNGYKLIKGWNFFIVLPEMEGKTLEDIKGSCEIKRAYAYDQFSRKWTNLEGVSFSRSTVSYGFVMKVKDDCVLGESSVIGLPPSLPDEEGGVAVQGAAAAPTVQATVQTAVPEAVREKVVG